MDKERATSQDLLVDRQTYIRPIVLRDDRGQIRWNLPENTLEENMQLGIRNIQALFLDRFPQFDQRFPRSQDGKIAEEKKVEAEEFILSQIGAIEKFNTVFGQTPHDRRKVKYFEGSHISAISKSFTPWGIEFTRFNLPKVDTETGVWIDQDGQSWAAMSYYSDKFGLDYEGTKRFLSDIKVINGLTRTNKPTFLFNEAELEEKVGNFMSLPQINTRAEVYTDEEGKKWVSLKYLIHEYGVSNNLIERGLQNAATKVVRNTHNQLVTLYEEVQIDAFLAAFTSLPKVDDNSGKYLDEEGQNWVPLTQIARAMGMATATLKKQLEDVRSIRGRDKSGREAILYNETEILSQFRQLPVTDKRAARYVDEEGLSWIGIQTLAKELLLTVSRVQLLLKDTPSISGINSTGRISDLYPEEQARQYIRKFFTLPQIDKKMGVYTDKKGEVWSTAFYFRRKFGKLAYSVLSEISSIEGVATNGAKVKLYPESIIGEKINQYLSLPQVDQKTGKFVDNSGEIWAPLNFFYKRFKISDSFARNLLENSSFMIARGQRGRNITLYPETTTLALLEGKLSYRSTSVTFKDDKYLDPDGEYWATLLHFSNELGIDYETLKRKVENIETKIGLNRTGKKVVLYKESVVREQVRGYLALPIVDRQTGRLTDENGNTWVTLSYIDSQFKYSFSLSKRLLADIQPLRARDRVGRETNLYPEEEAMRRLQAFYDLPTVDKETGRYVDEEGQNWVSTEQLATELGINGTTGKRLGEDLPTIKGRDRMGKEADLVHETEARKKFGSLASLPIVDSTGRFIDSNGKQWVVGRIIFKELGISISDKKRQSLDLESVEGRGGNGHKATLYKEQDVRDKLAKFLALPQVDKETGRYMDEGGIGWVPFQYFRNQFGVSKGPIFRNRELPFIQGRDRRGIEVKLYSEAEVRKVLELTRKQEPDISPEQANKMLKRLLEG